MPIPLDSSAARPRSDLLVCDECDAVHARTELPPGHAARCVRCNALLGRGHKLGLDGMLALAIAALVCIVIGNVTPLVALDARGLLNTVTLPGAALHTWEAGEQAAAALGYITAAVLPLATIVLRIALLWPLVRGRRPALFCSAMRLLRFTTRWGMVEVFMLGALVAVVRSAGLARAFPGPGLIAYGVLTLLLTGINAGGLHRLWQAADDLPESEAGDLPASADRLPADAATRA